MKKIHLIILYLAFLNSGFGQPIMDNSWFYSIDDSIYTAYYYPEVSNEPDEGLNIVWDISDAPTPYGEREILIVDPMELEYHNDFPEATLAYKQTFDREYYLNIDNGKLKLIGYRSPNFKITYENGFPIIGYDNFEYGDTENETYVRKNINLETLDTTIYNEVDEFVFAGFGTVITPIGTYENCVMTKLTRTSQQTPFIEYRFHKDRLANIIASHLRYTGGNTEPVHKIEYQISQNTTSVNDLDVAGIEFKGPIENSILMNSMSEFDSRLQIIDVSGRIIMDEFYKVVIGKNEIGIDTLEPNNIYFLLITNKSSGLFQTYQFHK